MGVMEYVHDTNLDLLVDISCKITLLFGSKSFGKIRDSDKFSSLEKIYSTQNTKATGYKFGVVC